MTTPDSKRKLFFAACSTAYLLFLLLPGVASADNFDLSCRELNASPDKNLPAPYKAVWDGSILSQIAADSNGNISQSSERVIAAKRLPMPNGKGLKYSFITGIQKTTKNRLLTNISVEPTGNPSESTDFIASVSYANVDSDGFLITAFEVVNEKCTLSVSDAGAAPAEAAPSPSAAAVAPATATDAPPAP